MMYTIYRKNSSHIIIMYISYIDKCLYELKKQYKHTRCGSQYPFSGNTIRQSGVVYDCVTPSPMV